MGRPHTGHGPGDEDGPLESKYGGLSGFNDAPPATGSHDGDGLLQNLLPAYPQLPLCRSLRVGPHSSLEPDDGQYTSTRSGSTTSEASTVEVKEPGVTSPPPGLTPQDFSNWSLPLPGAPQTGGLPLPSGGGVDRQAESPWAPGPQGPNHNPRCRALLRECSWSASKGRANQLPRISDQRCQRANLWLLISYQCCQ